MNRNASKRKMEKKKIIWSRKIYTKLEGQASKSGLWELKETGPVVAYEGSPGERSEKFGGALF